MPTYRAARYVFDRIRYAGCSHTKLPFKGRRRKLRNSKVPLGYRLRSTQFIARTGG